MSDDGESHLSSEAGLAYAGFWRRAAALIIDCVIADIAVLLLAVLINLSSAIAVIPDLQIVTPVSTKSRPLLEHRLPMENGQIKVIRQREERREYFFVWPFHFLIVEETIDGERTKVIKSEQLIDPKTRDPLSSITAGKLSIVVLFFYLVFSEQSRWQASLGKRLMRVTVVDGKGAKVTFLRAFCRNLVKVPLLAAGTLLNLWSIAAFAGFAVAAWSKSKQALHDKIAGTMTTRPWEPHLQTA